jgi:WD40 repeat protein
MKSQIYKWMALVAMLFCLVLVVTNATAKKGGKPPKDPPPVDDPVTIQPAFAYYCKSNPNSGGVCLANADGSQSVRIFTTSKFQGSQFELSAYQGAGQGAVLVVDKLNLWKIDYLVDSEGNLAEVGSPVQKTSREISGPVFTVDWSPDGTRFAFSSGKNLYIDSRANFGTGQWGLPIVSAPIEEDEGQHIGSMTWGSESNILSFIRLFASANNGPHWYELHKVNIEGALTDNGITVDVTQCLLATHVYDESAHNCQLN